MAAYTYLVQMRNIPTMRRTTLSDASGMPRVFPTWSDADQAARRQAEQMARAGMTVVGGGRGRYEVRRSSGTPVWHVAISRGGPVPDEVGA